MYWDTFTEATGTVADPDGGTLAFEVDQGPAKPWTKPWLDLAVDVGFDFDGGWYLAIDPFIVSDPPFFSRV